MMNQVFEGINLQFSTGDILRSPSNVIVNSIGGDLNLYNAGALARNIGHQGGPNIQDELSQMLEEFVQDGVVLTGAGNLTNTRYILHLRNSVNNRNHFGPRILKTLRKANGAGFQDMAFPALGSGGCGHNPMSMCTEFADAIRSFAREALVGPRVLHTIKFLFEARGTMDIYAQFFRLEGTNSSGTGGIQSGLAMAVVIPRMVMPSSARFIRGPPAPTTNGGSGSRTTTTAGTNTAAQRQGNAAAIAQSAVDTFQCSVCISVMREPVILCVHCHQLVGCDECVRSVVTAGHGQCPLCRHPWMAFGNDVQSLSGLGGFLGLLRA